MSVTLFGSLSYVLYAKTAMIPCEDSKRRQNVLLEQDHKKNSHVYGINNLLSVLTKSSPCEVWIFFRLMIVCFCRGLAGMQSPTVIMKWLPCAFTHCSFLNLLWIIGLAPFVSVIIAK